MREVKFRGKEIGTGKVVFGNYIKYEHMGKVKHIIVTNWAQVYVNSYFCFAKSIGQYTGVNDKNGKEIYEGDVVKFGNTLYEVIFDVHMFNLKDFYCSCLDYPTDAFSEGGWCFEVVGNIYENPELLKEV